MMKTRVLMAVAGAVLLVTLAGCGNMPDMDASETHEVEIKDVNEGAEDQVKTINETERGLFQLHYYALQVMSVENDLRYWYMVSQDRRNTRKPADEIAVLENLATELEALEIPDTVTELRQTLGMMLEALKKAAEDMPTDDAEPLESVMAPYWDKRDIFNNNFSSMAKEYVSIAHFDPDIGALHEDLRYFTDTGDRELFKNASDAFGNKQYEDAVIILEPLLEKYRGHTEEGSILVFFVSAHIAHDSPFIKMSGDVEPSMLALLDDYIERMPYSHHDYQLYLQWRTLSQKRHGHSNWSAIPNLEYNKTWRRFVQAGMDRIDEYPDDRRAKHNTMYLLQTPLIERFADNSPFGNTSIIHKSMIRRWQSQEDMID